MVVPKPAVLTFEQGAALPIAATTALRGIRDVGEVKSGQRVLVNGAGGGVGTFAVQIAAALGAEVTGVCSTANLELVSSIGAQHVIDYTNEDFTDGRTRYDVILDNVSSLPLNRLRGALTPKGTLVLNGGGSPGHVFGPVGTLLRAVVANAFVHQRLRPLPSRQDRGELLAVTGLIEEGKLTPVVDRTYPLHDVVEGLRYMEKGHARGKVVVTVA
jgi:NADPH:quinone reductase-like Zn-dependent oxidoreductase